MFKYKSTSLGVNKVANVWSGKRVSVCSVNPVSRCTSGRTARYNLFICMSTQLYHQISVAHEYLSWCDSLGEDLSLAFPRQSVLVRWADDVGRECTYRTHRGPPRGSVQCGRVCDLTGAGTELLSSGPTGSTPVSST